MHLDGIYPDDVYPVNTIHFPTAFDDYQFVFVIKAAGLLPEKLLVTQGGQLSG